MRDHDLTLNEAEEDSLLALITEHFRPQWKAFQKEFAVTIPWSSADKFEFKDEQKYHPFYHLTVLNDKLNEGCD